MTRQLILTVDARSGDPVGMSVNEPKEAGAVSLMSMRQYAKHRGVSPEAVSKAVKAGRIPTVNDEKGARKIDPKIADREWIRNSDPSKVRNSNEEESADLDESDLELERKVGSMLPFKDAKAIGENYRSKLAKLEYEERIGKLVDADQVERQWVAVASVVRSKVLGIPSKARQRSPDLTADQYAVLEAVVREALESLTDV